MVIFSCVRARPAGGGGGGVGFLADVRRMNVAFTRARCARLGFACKEFWEHEVLPQQSARYTVYHHRARSPGCSGLLMPERLTCCACLARWACRFPCAMHEGCCHCACGCEGCLTWHPATAAGSPCGCWATWTRSWPARPGPPSSRTWRASAPSSPPGPLSNACSKQGRPLLCPQLPQLQRRGRSLLKNPVQDLASDQLPSMSGRATGMWLGVRSHQSQCMWSGMAEAGGSQVRRGGLQRGMIMVGSETWAGSDRELAQPRPAQQAFLGRRPWCWITGAQALGRRGLRAAREVVGIHHITLQRAQNAQQAHRERRRRRK